MKAREVHLKSRPVGTPKPDNFAIVEVDVPEPKAGEALVRNTWMSVDPYMRGRMYDRPSYVPPFQLNEALQGGAVGVVEKSNDPSLKPGDLVESMNGWREAFVAYAGGLQKLPQENIPSQAYLGVLGIPGFTAYTSLHRIGEPKKGETIFVSGAAGAVGSAVCQISKILGLTVVGSAGSDDKLAWLKSLGVDQTINYKKGDLLTNLRAAAPNGIDIYFDNVGGEHLEVALEVARPFARFVECGMISQYNVLGEPVGPRNLIYVVGKSLKIQGFIVIQFQHLRDQFETEMAQWIRDGRIKWEETVKHGIDEAAPAFLGLFDGSNTGKMLVKLS